MIHRTPPGTIGVILLLAWAISFPSAAPEGWEIVSQQEFSLEGVEGLPHSLSPDGTWLLSIGQEHGFCLYRAVDLSPRGCYRPEVEGSIWLSQKAIAWAPKGRRLTFGTLDGRLWLLDVEEGQLAWLPSSIVGEPPIPAWSPDGESLAVGGGGAIVVAPPGALAEAPVTRYEGILAGLKWADGNTLIYGLRTPDEGSFQLWRVAADGSGQPELLWSDPYPSFQLLALSPDGRWAWTGVGLVDLERGEWVPVREERNVSSFAFSPNGSWWLYVYWAVKDLETHYILALRRAGAPEEEEQVLLDSPVRQISILGWAVTDLVGVLLVSTENPGLAFLQLASQNKSTLSLPEEAYGFRLAWAPDGSGLVVLYLSDEGKVAEWFEVPGGESRWQVTGLNLPNESYPMAFSPGGEELAVGEWHWVRFLAASDGATLRTIELEERFRPLALAYRPDGSLAMVLLEMRGYGYLHLEIWSPAGRLEEQIELGKSASQRPKAVFSPDGRWLAYAAGTDDEPGGEAWLVHLLDLESGSVRTWDLREIVPDFPWTEPRVQIAGIAIRPDGQEVTVGLYSADAGQPLILRLDTETGELIGQLFPVEWEQYMVEELSYSSDGRFLAFSGYSPMFAILFYTLAIVNLVQEDPELTLLCQSRDPQDLRECPSRSPCFSPDGQTLASMWRDKIQLWDLCPNVSQLPAPEWAFIFSSGGAYHPEGLGEWRVQVDGFGNFEVVHQVEDEVESFGPFQLEAEENQQLWELIQAADIPNRESSTRPGVPDEVQYTFTLKSATCVYQVTLWIGDAQEDEVLMALVDELAMLIEKYTGQVPRLG